MALREIFRFSPRKMCWKASCVPEAPSRSNRSIGPEIFDPGTSLQSRILPVKMPSTDSWERLQIGLASLVITHTPSRAIFVKTSPFGSTPLIGSREESPMSKRPSPTPLMPMSDWPPPTLGRGDLRVGLVVGAREFLRQRQHGGGAADDQAPGGGGGRHGEDEGEGHRDDQGAVGAHVGAPLFCGGVGL